MRIRNLHIDGFGRFADRSFGPLEHPVTVFYGANERQKYPARVYPQNTVRISRPARRDQRVSSASRRAARRQDHDSHRRWRKHRH